MTRAGIAGAALAALLVPAPALGDLGDDIQVLTNRFRAEGAEKIVVLPPRVLTSRDTVPIPLPGSATSDTGAGCTTVTVLGAVSTVFALRLPGGDRAAPASEFLPSVAGAQMLVRCGVQRKKLAELSLEMRSPRGVIETMVAESRAALPELRSLLMHRDPGFIPAPGRPPGPTPHPGPLVARVAAFEGAWIQEGVDAVVRRTVVSDDAGAGRLILELSPGCHRIAVLGVDPEGPEPRVNDIDAELAWVSGEVASVDRTDSPDATLTACTAASNLAIVAFAGAASHGSVLILRGRTDLPRGVPDEWGGAARSRVAKTLLERHAPEPASPPIYASLGVAGITILPIDVEPGGCYLAALALVEGTAKLVSLTADAGAAPSAAHTDDPGAGAVATFCAAAVSRGVLEVEVHGASLVWALGLWPMGHRRLGEEAP